MSVEQSGEWELAGETEVFEETYPIAILSTTNPTRLDLGWNTSRRSGKPTTNSPSHCVYSYALNIDAVRSSESYLNRHHTTRRHVVEESVLHNHIPENHK
jgi:hypothetical protein